MLRLSELYTSVQGEGPFTGLPTQFVRFAGCNMRCPGWPCDTPHAIDPAIWRKEAESISAKDLADRILEHPVSNVCLTGGEPFLQKNDELGELVRILYDEDVEIECFTNGSFPFPDWALHNMYLMMDWKLIGSGEAYTKRSQRGRNAKQLLPGHSIKFVVTNHEDLNEAFQTTMLLKAEGCGADFWVGAAWGRITEAEIVEYMIKNQPPWRLNVQVHKFIYHPDARKV